MSLLQASSQELFAGTPLRCGAHGRQAPANTRQPQRHVRAAGRRRTTTSALRDPLLLRVARGEEAERTPVWLMRQAGRYMADFRKFSDRIPFRERSETPDIAIELSLQPWKAFGTDGVIMFSDILTILPALGIEFDMVKGRGPVIMNPIRSVDDAANLRTLTDPASALPFIQTILQTLRMEIDTDTTLIGFVGSPWTLAAYAIEGEGNKSLMRTKSMMFHDPQLLHQILKALEDALVAYMSYQINCGAQVMQVFDSWAHHLTPGQFREFSMPYAESLIQRVRALHPSVPLIFHANGGTGKLHSIQHGCSADVIGIDWGSDMRKARSTFGPNVVLQGNVDPLVLLGPPEVIRSAALSCIEEARSPAGGRHILNLGHGVVQGTPEEAVQLFCQVAKESSATVAA